MIDSIHDTYTQHTCNRIVDDLSTEIMAKQMNCKTVICKVNGITFLDLNQHSIDKCYSHSEDNGITAVATHNRSPPQTGLTITDDINIDTTNQNNNTNVDNDSEDKLMTNTTSTSIVPKVSTRISRSVKMIKKKTIPPVKVSKIDSSIESVRTYIMTTRKHGKVWHSCHYHQPDRPLTCTYGSKWSGAIVNHIRSHLGIKPFRCGYCQKPFTIACNLKNHLRIHHGVKAKIILKRIGNRNSFKVVNTYQQNTKRHVTDQTYFDDYSDDNSKLRIFKPSFMNGTNDDNPYATTPTSQRRDVPKRTAKKNPRYVDFEEDYDDYIDDDVQDNEDEEIEEPETHFNEEEAEVENTMFYERTNEDKTENDCFTKYITKRKYNKILWYVCLWNPRQCKYRSHEQKDVMTHIQKHLNISLFTCNWDQCSASFADQQQLINHQMSHTGAPQLLKCNYKNCQFKAFNEKTLRLHKNRHKTSVL
ncbi:zinc finger protein 236-like [Oppia nitens]|uniref:zinc finger protein 236-like n=1 Tax=Oppia nitens TaxID=1686743 RepID=UPI0023DA9F33|nr:zinc finger protein 236-like [Oppia nitens]